MTFKSTPLVASLCAALSLVGPRPAYASAPAAEAPSPSSDPETKVKIGLVIDTSEIAEEFRKQLELTTTRRLRPALEAAGYEVTDGFVDLALRVRFAPVKNGVFRDHGIYFDFIKGNEVERAIEWVLCNACGLAPLEEALDQATPQLIDAVNKKVAQAPATQTHDDGPENGGDGDTGDGDGDSTEPPKRIGPLGISGTVVLAVGVGLSIGGGVVLANPTRLSIGEEAQFGIERDLSRRGIGLLVPGATLVVVGAVMLAVDVTKRGKQRKRAEGITVIPALSPTSAGLGIIGRF